MSHYKHQLHLNTHNGITFHVSLSHCSAIAARMITQKSFYYLAILCLRGGWVWKYAIEPGDNQSRYIYRLKKEFPPIAKYIENNRRGCYRINEDDLDIIIDYESLKAMENHEIDRLIKL